MNGDGGSEPHVSQASHRQAEHKRSWWPGAIWAIPVAAVGIIAWLALRSVTGSGPTVEVVFDAVADLRPGDTKVTFEGYKVGQVEDAHLEPDLKHMRAKLSLDPDMKGHLGQGTRFWMIGKDFSLAHLSDVKSLISGVSIGIEPHEGEKQGRYDGLAEAPVLHFGESGTAMTLHTGSLGSLQPGSAVSYRGKQVGKVVGVQMTGVTGFDISAFIDTPHDGLVHDNTRFWRAGPVRLATGGSGPSLKFDGLPALIEGAVAFDTPNGIAPGPQAAAGQGFTLYDGQDAAENAPGLQGVRYRVVFPHATGVPEAEAPVTLMGKQIGTVADSSLRYDPAQGHVEVLATIVLEPRRVALANDADWTGGRAQMDDMLRHLVADGLHAELSASPPVIGGQQVSLQFVPGQPGVLGDGPVPEIPSTAGGGVAGIMAEVNNVMTKVDQMPLPQIADNLQAISRSVAQLTSSPALTATLHQVDRSTANLQRITRSLDQNVPPALDQLRRTVTEAQSSIASVQGLLSAKGAAASAPGSEGLPQTLYEVTRTARALRELSDFIDRNPSAILTGRSASR